MLENCVTFSKRRRISSTDFFSARFFLTAVSWAHHNILQWLPPNTFSPKESFHQPNVSFRYQSLLLLKNEEICIPNHKTRLMFSFPLYHILPHIAINSYLSIKVTHEYKKYVSNAPQLLTHNNRKQKRAPLHGYSVIGLKTGYIYQKKLQSLKEKDLNL